MLVHGDAHVSNVVVDPASGAFRSLIDWGWEHIVARTIDSRVIPLPAVGPMLDGYRDIDANGPLEADILLAKLRLLAPAPSAWS